MLIRRLGDGAEFSQFLPRLHSHPECPRLRFVPAYGYPSDTLNISKVVVSQT